jgi:hypothetical protein
MAEEKMTKQIIMPSSAIVFFAMLFKLHFAKAGIFCGNLVMVILILSFLELQF